MKSPQAFPGLHLIPFSHWVPIAGIGKYGLNTIRSHYNLNADDGRETCAGTARCCNETGILIIRWRAFCTNLCERSP